MRRAANNPQPSAHGAWKVFLAACAAFLAACDMPWKVAGGSGTETSNGEVVAARIFTGKGAPVAGALVYARPADYLKDTLGIDSISETPPDAITDENGFFRLNYLDAGSWKAEVRGSGGQAVLLGFDVESGANPKVLIQDTLRPVGTLQGKVEIPPGAAGSLYVQVYGMERLARTNDTGFFILPDLPAGQIKFRVLSSQAGISYPAPSLAVIKSGDTVDAGTLRPISFGSENYSEWPFSRRIYLNTLAAGVADTVTDFPLLVRLDAERFDFALSDGKDIRFSSPNGTHLPYQRDSWDPNNYRAAFWVKLDSVFGSGGEQYITLHFGKRDAPDFSDGKAVFSSFGGAWHFSDSLDSKGQGFFSDASPSGATGTARVLPQERQGVIGAGAGFRGAHSVVAEGTAAMRPSAAVTLSTWVSMAGTGTMGGELATMGDNYGLRSMTDGNAHFFVFTDTSVKDPTWNPYLSFPKVQTKGLDLRGKWHHVAGRYDKSGLRVFVDGVEKASYSHTLPLYYPFRKEFRMGVHGNGSNSFSFSGSLDEVQVSPIARSASWIKLSYESQRPGSTFLEFR